MLTLCWHISGHRNLRIRFLRVSILTTILLKLASQTKQQYWREKQRRLVSYCFNLEYEFFSFYGLPLMCFTIYDRFAQQITIFSPKSIVVSSVLMLSWLCQVKSWPMHSKELKIISNQTKHICIWYVPHENGFSMFVSYWYWTTKMFKLLIDTHLP